MRISSEPAAAGQRVVGTSFKPQAAGGIRQQQRRQQCLEQQQSAAGRAYCKVIVATPHLARMKCQIGGSNLHTDSSSGRNFTRGLYAGQMLAHQTGLAALTTNVNHPERLPGGHGKCKSRAQHLPATRRTI